VVTLSGAIDKARLKPKHETENKDTEPQPGGVVESIHHGQER
jgi:hypothetical protein